MKSATETRRDNLAAVLRRCNISQTVLAKMMDLGNPSIINQHVRGTKNIGDKFARRYEEVLGIPTNSLDGDAEKLVTKGPIGMPNAFAKAMATQLGASPAEPHLTLAQDNGMAPNIAVGDWVLIDFASTDVVSGNVYLIELAGDKLIRRIFKRPDGGLRITGDSDDKARFPDWDIEPEQLTKVAVLGMGFGVLGRI